MLVRGTRDGGAFGRRSDRASSEVCRPRRALVRAAPASGEANERAPKGLHSSEGAQCDGSLACKTQERIRGLEREAPRVG